MKQFSLENSINVIVYKTEYNKYQFFTGYGKKFIVGGW